MIVLFTDFGLQGPYIGQVKAVLHAHAPGVALIDLFSDAPAHNPKAAAYLLAAYHQTFAAGTVFFSVVDPGVGGKRRALVIRAFDKWFVGPDNGLFELLLRRDTGAAECWEILWRPDQLSASFHGRDLFAPISASLAVNGKFKPDDLRFQALNANDVRRSDWPDELAEIVYIDHFGNAMTGMRATHLSDGVELSYTGERIIAAETFSTVPPGTPFFYENANGLIEISVSEGRAAEKLQLDVGTRIEFVKMRQ